MKNGFKILIIVIITLLIAEGGLRLTGIFSSYTEKNFGYFLDPFEQKYVSHYWLWGPDETMTIENTEFTYTYTTNSMGILDDELDSSAAPFGLALLGDSFVMGSGADQDSSMPRQLEEICQLKDTNRYILNAGIAGSDVFFATRVLQDKLLPIGFSQYAICINTSDLYDYAWRGGEERFRDDGYAVTKERPSYMSIYRASHLARAVMHVVLGFDHSFYTKSRMQQIKKEAIQRFGRDLQETRDEVLASGAQFHVIIHPYPKYYAHQSKSLRRDYKFLQEMHEGLLQNGVSSHDLSQGFDTLLTPSNYLEYSWPMDMHFNSAGYRMFAELVCEVLSD